MLREEATAVSAMVYTTFHNSLASGYSEEGQREFLQYAAPDRLLERLDRGHRILVATEGERIVGVIEVRPPAHIAQLFVQEPYQGRGIARSLLDAAFPESLTAPGLTVTVNAAPDTITTYGRLGFRVIAAEQMHEGIRFVPMLRIYGPVFFPVSLTKFTVMSIATFGIYPITWIYWNWRYERDRAGEGISPFWRTFFAPIWINSLFHRVKRAAGQAGVRVRWSVGVTTLATILVWFCAFLREPWTLVSMLSFIPAIPVQHTVNEINRRVAPASPTNSRFGVANVVMIAIGVLLWVLVVWGLTTGVREPPAGTVSV